MSTARETIEQLVKKMIFDVALKAAITRIVSAAPFLAWPVVNPVFVFAITKLAEKLYAEMALVVDFAVIDFRTDQERRAYEAAVAELRRVAQPPQGGTPNAEEIERARQELERRLADLIRLPGVREN